MHSLFVIYETNHLSLVSIQLDNNYQIQTILLQYQKITPTMFTRFSITLNLTAHMHWILNIDKK